ncbi:uncharacterized protein METZ01_LOCUS496502 [marine metagenome]|uniref:dihydroneopterin aldolase n=1 Tax=marine metagenome TaxID=408172 RepID=A0A383DIH0_9ZZZZ
MSITVSLENYRIRGPHGWFEWEREQGQDLVITVRVRIDENSIEQLSDTMDYGQIQQVIHDEVADGEPTKLLEHLGQRIIARLNNFEQTSSIHVRIEKPAAPLPHSGGLSVVECDWVREQ